LSEEPRRYGSDDGPAHCGRPHVNSASEEAEVIVVNTCSFIDPAKQESVDTILEMAEHKKTGIAKKLIVAGCLVERYRGDIQKDLPEVDALIGTNELDKVVALCQGEEPTTNPFEPYLYHDLTPRVLSTPKHYAYIKISEGCDHPCSFCVIRNIAGQTGAGGRNP
jgi:ribosomal protein S12 methylthiotransferase